MFLGDYKVQGRPFSEKVDNAFFGHRAALVLSNLPFGRRLHLELVDEQCCLLDSPQSCGKYLCGLDSQVAGMIDLIKYAAKFLTW